VAKIFNLAKAAVQKHHMFKTRNHQYSEKEIVEGCVRNERFFQELLYRTHFERMIAMCMRYTDDRDIGMEIVNNGFLRVFKKLDTFSFKGSLEGWIRKLVYHSLSEYFKKHSKYLQFLVFEDHDTSVSANALSNMYEEDLLKMVDTLPPATKQVFQLYAIEGFTHPEIAKRLSISTGTSKWHLATAREKLKQLIKQQSNYKFHAG
jgi:RNA polymerase sigma-70 factor (ECF subfamily)